MVAVFVTAYKHRSVCSLDIHSPARGRTRRKALRRIHLLAQVDRGGWEPTDWSLDNNSLLVRQEISINQANLFRHAADHSSEVARSDPLRRCGSQVRIDALHGVTRRGTA